MFYGKMLIALQVVVVLQTIVQVHNNLPNGDVYQHAFKQNALPHVGFGIGFVGIEVHHVAATKVRKEVVGLFRNVERQRVHPIIAVAFLCLLQFKGGKNVSCFSFFGQRHVPKVGSAVALRLLCANLCQQLFVVNEGKHAAYVGAFQCF